MDFIQFLKKYNSYTVPVISVIVAWGFFYLSMALLNITEEALTFILLIPVAVFFIMHYLGLYGIKKRLIQGLIISLLVALVGSAVNASFLPLQDNQVTTQMPHYGINVTATETPYATVASSYNISLVLTNVSNFSSANYWLVISGYATGYTDNISKSHLKALNEGGKKALIYYNTGSLKPDLYFYTFYFQEANNSVTGVGPILSYSASLVLMLQIHYLPYLVLFELMFVTGVFIARTIENSKKARMVKPS